MSEDQNPNAGTQSPDQSSAGTQNAGGDAPKTVPYDRFSEVNSAKREAEKRATELAARLAQYESADKKREEEAAIARGDFEKVLAELRPQAERAKLLEAELTDTLAAELKDVPEDYRDLIPDGDITAKLKWVRNAKAKGLFAARRAPGLDGGAGGAGGGKALPQLTAEEIQMARNLQISPESYAKQKAALLAAKDDE